MSESPRISNAEQSQLHVFFSYSRKDTETVRQIEAGLRQRGIDVWIDYSGVEAGDRFAEVIEEAISDSVYFLIAISFASITSEWVIRELQFASEIQKHKPSRFIIPILLDNCDIPPSLLALHHIDMRQKEYHETSLDELADAMKAHRGTPAEDQSDADDPLFLDRLREQIKEQLGAAYGDTATEDDIFMQPIVSLVTDCVKFDLYEGVAIDRISDCFMHFSHDSLDDRQDMTDHQSLVFILLVGIAKRFQKKSLAPDSYPIALSRFVTNEYIGTGFRNMILSALLDLPHLKAQQVIIQDVIPRVFPLHRLSVLGNALISDALIGNAAKAQELLYSLWDRSPYRARFNISHYIGRHLRWANSETPCEIDNLKLRATSAFAKFQQDETYFSCLSDTPDEFLLAAIEPIIASALNNDQVNPEYLVEAMEILVQITRATEDKALIRLYEKVLLKLIEPCSNWGEATTARIAVELSVSRFIDVIASHAALTYIAAQKSMTSLIAMHRDSNAFWLAPKCVALQPQPEPFIVEWYNFCKEMKGQLPHLLMWLERVDNINPKARLARYIRKLPEEERDPFDRSVFSYCLGKQSMVDAAFEVVGVWDKSWGGRLAKLRYKFFESKKSG